MPLGEPALRAIETWLSEGRPLWAARASLLTLYPIVALAAAAAWLEPMTKSGVSTPLSSESFLRVLYLSKR